jgi:hypothetical protein
MGVAIFRKVLTAKQIQQEVHRRILISPQASSHPWDVSLRLSKAHAADAEARNWHIETVVRVEHSVYIRHVVDVEMQVVLYFDDAERDEIMGHFIVHR